MAQRREPSLRLIITNLTKVDEEALRESQSLSEDASPATEATNTKSSTKRNSISSTRKPSISSNVSTKLGTPGARQSSTKSIEALSAKPRSTGGRPIAATTTTAILSTSHKRKSSDDSAERPLLKRVSTDQDETESDLSERGRTPECPTSLREQISSAALEVKHELDVPSNEPEAATSPILGSATEVFSSQNNHAIDTATEGQISPPTTASSNQLDIPTEEPSPSGLVSDVSPPAAPPTPHPSVNTESQAPLELSSPDPLAISPAVLSPESADHTLASSAETLVNDSDVEKISAVPARKLVRLTVKSISPSAASLSGPSPTVPATPSSRPRRTVKQPLLFDGYVPTPEVTEEKVTTEESRTDYAGDSPTAQKVSRKANNKKALSSEKVSKDDLAADAPTAKRAPRKRTADKVSENDLADDVPAAKKAASRKRKAETSEPTPRKKPTPKPKSSGESKVKSETPRKPRARKTPVSKKKAALSLPSPASSEPEYPDTSGFIIDPNLLKFSRAMTRREPLASKPEPCGMPDVWAPGRQELCETLPYFKSAHSGCYANGGNVYAFMFDSVGVGREYMDQDVIIARMGGHMTRDPKTGAMYQKYDHDINDTQPQSLLNNIAQKNPLVIICGNQNAGAPTKMPYRYCVLGWFKPTHVWAERTMGKKDQKTTIRYRFERLDRSKPSWFEPVPGSVPEAEVNGVSVAGALPTAADNSLPVKTCKTCLKSCPQIYLISWICTNPVCADLWKLSDGQDAPYGDLDYHPAFLQHRTRWEREDAPFSLNPGVPQLDQHFGDNLSYVSTRGIVCPTCGRCNTRYLFTHWRCDTPGCKWKLIPPHRIVMPSNLQHTPWDMASDGPSLIKSMVKPVIHTQIGYFGNYKVAKYTIEGVEGCIFVAKANKAVVSEPGGPDDMFRELQGSDIGLERRMMRKTADDGAQGAAAEVKNSSLENNDLDAPEEDDGDDPEDEHNGEVGARMNAFGMNFGMPYKFIANGDSQSFENAPAAIHAARTRLNWAQRVFVNDASGFQDFNEELVFAYLEGQKIKYHDDGEKGLGPRIATLSLGAPATMSLRVKAKYFSHVSNTGVFTDEKPLPLPLLESSGYASGYKRKAKKAAAQGKAAASRDIYEDRHKAWAELQGLKQAGQSEAFRVRSKEIPKELELRRKAGDPLISFHLTHGDIVIMEGEQIQKFLEHAVEPHGHLRFALTCRTVLSNHLKTDQLPTYEVKEDPEPYDGKAIREEGDGDAVVWQ